MNNDDQVAQAEAKNRHEIIWKILLLVVSVLVFIGVFLLTSGSFIRGLSMVAVGTLALIVSSAVLRKAPKSDWGSFLTLFALLLASETKFGPALDALFPGKGSEDLGFFSLALGLVGLAVSWFGGDAQSRRQLEVDNARLLLEVQTLKASQNASSSALTLNPSTPAPETLATQQGPVPSPDGAESAASPGRN